MIGTDKATVAVIVTTLLITAIAAQSTLQAIEQQERRDISSVMDTVLKTTQRALQLWWQERSIDISTLAHSRDLYKTFRTLTSSDRIDARYRSKLFSDLADKLDRFEARHNYLDFVILDLNGNQIAPRDQVKYLPDDLMDSVQTALSGKFTIGTPVFSHGRLRDIELPSWRCRQFNMRANRQ